MKFPIVLTHGVCRFDKVWNQLFKLDNRDDVRLDRLHYFRGIRTRLVAEGFTVFHANVPWAACVQARAAALGEQIGDYVERTKCGKVHIIAHSMGGLDARQMIFAQPQRISKIASITTIGTPHHGSSFADWGLKHMGQVVTIAAQLGLDLSAFKDLTQPACEAFNKASAAHEKACSETIRMQSYTGIADFLTVFIPLKLPYSIIQRTDGPNDGLVSVASAQWGEFKGAWERTDHRDEIGWANAGRWLVGERKSDLEKRIQDRYVQIARDVCEV